MTPARAIQAAALAAALCWSSGCDLLARAPATSPAAGPMAGAPAPPPAETPPPAPVLGAQTAPPAVERKLTAAEAATITIKKAEGKATPEEIRQLERYIRGE